MDKGIVKGIPGIASSNQRQQLDTFVLHILFLTMSNTNNFLQLPQIIFQMDHNNINFVIKHICNFS